jgi:PadR family transcriptional regulator, regulatory protein PadR
MTPLKITPETLDVLGAFLENVDSPVFGLQLVKATGRKSGTIYPILARLEHAGWLTSEWETDTARTGARRRLYRLTGEGVEAGRRELIAAAQPARRAGLIPGWSASC